MTAVIEESTQTADERYEAGAYDGVLQSLDSTGDTRVLWDQNNATEVSVAKAAFDAALARGAAIFRAAGKNGKRQEQQIREFDPTAERLIVVPQIVGG